MVTCRNVGGPRVGHTEWSKLKRERPISCNITSMWNLEKWYWWTYLQSRNSITNVENKLMVTKGGSGRWDELGDWDWHIHTTTYKIDN